MQKSNHRWHSLGSFSLQLLGLLVVFSLLLELGARISRVEKRFPYRSLGGDHFQFEIKWFKLQDYVKNNGGVDVIVLGNSMVNTGVDPDVLESAYFVKARQRLRVFNFGVEGVTVAVTDKIARLLVETYHPALLIYGTEMREYVDWSAPDTEVIFDSFPWFRYRLGDFNLPGWLVDHSMALQMLLPYRNWMQADFFKTNKNFRYRVRTTTASGYEADTAVSSDINAPLDASNPLDKADLAYSNYEMSPTRIADLQKILDLKKIDGTNIIVVEIPASSLFYTAVVGEAAHEQFQQTISQFTARSGALFLPEEPCSRVPVNGRANRMHLNLYGAPYFSACLGSQLADMTSGMDLEGTK